MFCDYGWRILSIEYDLIERHPSILIHNQTEKHQDK